MGYSVGSDHHVFWVGAEDWTQVGLEQTIPIGGLLLALPEQLGAFVETKVHTGSVGVEFRYHDAQPELSLELWEDADLVIVNSPLGDLCIAPVAGYGDFIDEIVPAPGLYAVCCSSRGRDDAADDEEADSLIEFYRFDIWPAKQGDVNEALKQTSAWGKEQLKNSQ